MDFFLGVQLHFTINHRKIEKISIRTVLWNRKRCSIPMLEPVLFFVVVNCFIGAIQTYDIPWVLSNSSAVGVIGGKNAFASYPVMEIVGNVYSGKAGNLGRACAEGFVLMLIIFAITLLQIVYRNCKNKDN